MKQSNAWKVVHFVIPGNIDGAAISTRDYSESEAKSLAERWNAEAPKPCPFVYVAMSAEDVAKAEKEVENNESE